MVANELANLGMPWSPQMRWVKVLNCGLCFFGLSKILFNFY